VFRESRTAAPPLGKAVGTFLARRDLNADTVRSYAQTMTQLRRELGDTDGPGPGVRGRGIRRGAGTGARPFTSCATPG
jgi:hypothetical protein